MTEKETWFIILEKDGKKGIGECGILRGLTATYANFLIINGAVLLPVYNSEKDAIAIAQMQKAFPEHEIVPIDCNALIKQHGSLHCVTMQYPKNI